MERIQVTDEWLYRYMPIAAEAFIEDIEKEIDYKYEFTVGFEKKMKRLFRWERHMGLRSAAYKVGRKCIHIAAVAMVFVFLCLMSIEAYRIIFFDTIKTVWEDSFLYRYIADNKGDEQPELHAPAYIPEGYVSAGENANELFTEYLYVDGAGRQLICQQEMIVDGRLVVYDSEYGEKTDLSIKGYTAELYRNDDGTIYAYLELGSSIYTIFAEELFVEDIREIFLHWVWERGEKNKYFPFLCNKMRYTKRY